MRKLSYITSDNREYATYAEAVATRKSFQTRLTEIREPFKVTSPKRAEMIEKFGMVRKIAR